MLLFVLIFFLCLLLPFRFLEFEILHFISLWVVSSMATTSPCPNVGCYFRNQRNWNFIWPAEALVLSRENLNSPGFIQSGGIFPRNLRHMFAPFSGGSRPSGLRASVCSAGCPKSSFLYFISLYFSTIGLGKQIISTKVVSFNIIYYFCSCCAIF